MFLVVLEPLPVHASATLIQENNDGCTTCVSITVSFLSPVSSGNVIVVGVGSVIPVTAISDSLGSSYTHAATASPGVMYANVYYATIGGTGGSDQVTVTLNTISGSDGGVYIYEVSGVTTAAAASAVGSGSGNAVTGFSTSTSTSVAFQSGAFLVGEVSVGFYPPLPFNAGSGFTASIAGANTIYSNAEYSVSGVSSSTNFPASCTGVGSGGLAYWAEVGIVLNPPPAPPIPEYPLGLPLLAIFMIFAYGLIKRRTRNPKNI